jgi:ketosteroid isomerase-like protein
MDAIPKLIGLFCALLITAACATLVPKSPVAAQSAERAADDFLSAFNALDQARFDPFFASDVTMFFPDQPFPISRVVGKDAVIAAFHQLFARVRARGSTQLGIEPRDMRIQDYGELAIVTFHLRGNGNIGRRSIIMRREQMGWRIVHFHASALEEPK